MLHYRRSIVELERKVGTKTAMTSASSVSKQAKHGSLSPPAEEQGGALHVRAFDLPPSSLLDATTRERLEQWSRRRATILSQCPHHWADKARLLEVRKFYDERFYPELIAEAKIRYDVRVEHETIGGVHTEIFTPALAPPSRARERVLINLHGGGFTMGALCAQLESIPVAAVSRTKVISVHYRMAPEYRFPAATEDVVAVYRALLRQHEPRDIGIFGCSAGALLAAQTIARLQKEELASPAAIAMLFGAGAFWMEGDSRHFASAVAGEPFPPLREHPYFEHADPSDPLTIPLNSADVLAKFPPALLLSATRDLALSSVVHMHSQLTALHVKAELRVWEGLHHAFIYDLSLSQSCEAHRATAEFFDRCMSDY